MATQSLKRARRRSGKRVRVYRLRNATKYKGDKDDIQCLSSWEYKFCEFLDNNHSIIEWSSENIAIPYVKPTDGKVHRYYPDFWIKYKNKRGELVEDIIEVKPAAQTKQPTTRGKRKKTQLFEQVQFAINIAKWKAAQQYCAKYGMNFQIVTENQLFK